MSGTRIETEAGANGTSPVVDLWPFLQSARAEARELDQAIRAIVKDHSSGRSINHGELLRAEYKRLVWVWKKKERLATELNNTLTKQAGGKAGNKHTRNRSFSPYCHGSNGGKPSSAGDTSTSGSDSETSSTSCGASSSASDTDTSSSDISSSESETSSSSGGAFSSPSDTSGSYVDVQQLSSHNDLE